MDIIALDDEELALNRLTKSISKVLPEAAVHTFMSAEDALEFAKNTSCEIAFLDIQGMDIDGIALAKRLKAINTKMNIIFCTGYSAYAMDAFELNASGYLLKPISEEKVRKAVENLRYEVNKIKNDDLYFRCFGSFEAFYNGKPIKFKREKTKELLAYLYNQKGAFCSNAEISCNIWEDDEHTSYLRQLKKDLIDTFKSLGLENIITKERNSICIDFNAIKSDYKDWLNGDIEAINSYTGEFMVQYSWAEETNAVIMGDFY